MNHGTKLPSRAGTWNRDKRALEPALLVVLERRVLASSLNAVALLARTSPLTLEHALALGKLTPGTCGRLEAYARTLAP